MPDFVINHNASALDTLDTIEIRGDDYQLLRSSAVVSAFFRRADLLELFNQTGCQGLRVYPALNAAGVAALGGGGLTTSNVADKFSMLAVGTTADRTDIVSGDSSLCFVAEAGAPASRFTEQKSRELVSSTRALIRQLVSDGMAQQAPFQGDSTRSTSKAFFHRSTLEALLPDGASGLRFFSTRILFEGRTIPIGTLMAATELTPNAFGDHGVASALPCPPRCPGGAYVDDER